MQNVFTVESKICSPIRHGKPKNWSLCDSLICLMEILKATLGAQGGSRRRNHPAAMHSTQNTAGIKNYKCAFSVLPRSPGLRAM